MERSWFINGQPSLFYLSSARAVARREGERGEPCEPAVIFLLHPLGAPMSCFSRGFAWQMDGGGIPGKQRGRGKQREQQMPGASSAPSPGSATPAPLLSTAGWKFICEPNPRVCCAAAAPILGIIIPKGLGWEGKRDLAALDQAEMLPKL